MRKGLIVAVLTLAGVLGGSSQASAWGFGRWFVCGYPAFCGYPYGWGGCASAGCRYYPPYYPWFAYYNYANSPYAWPNGYVAGNYPAYLPGAAYQPAYTPLASAPKEAQPATVTANLPADAELLFNGTPAQGVTGATRSFQTGPLTPGQNYEFTLTARVSRHGKLETVTETVRVKAGETTRVTLTPREDGVRVAGN